MLKQIPRIDYDTVLTFEWLENVFNDVKGDIIDKSMLVIKINNEELCFDIDDRLMDFFDLFTNPLTLSLWRGKKYDSSGVSTYLYYIYISYLNWSKSYKNTS